MADDRWVEVSASQFDHESEGLEFLRAAMPNEAPFRAWTNFEFRDQRGGWHEVDALVLGQDALYLLELKHFYGTISGNDRTWTRNGRTESSPLLLARRKAQYLASKLQAAFEEAAGRGARSARAASSRGCRPRCSSTIETPGWRSPRSRDSTSTAWTSWRTHRVRCRGSRPCSSGGWDAVT